MTEDDARNEDSDTGEVENDDAAAVRRAVDWARVLVYGILPGLILLLGLLTGFARWQQSSQREVQLARTESVAAARESAVALLSYQPDTVEQSMKAARGRLLSPYKEAYTNLTDGVVIPSARHDHVSVAATIPAAASASATPTHAVAILFVNQAVTVGANPPSTTLSSIRVTLEKTGGRWLISGFDPI